MIKHVLQAIEGIELYPMISLVLFLGSFAYVVYSVVRMKPSEVEHASHLPLDENETTASGRSIERIGD